MASETSEAPLSPSQLTTLTSQERAEAASLIDALLNGEDIEGDSQETPAPIFWDGIAAPPAAASPSAESTCVWGTQLPATQYDSPSIAGSPCPLGTDEPVGFRSQRPAAADEESGFSSPAGTEVPGTQLSASPESSPEEATQCLRTHLASLSLSTRKPPPAKEQRSPLRDLFYGNSPAPPSPSEYDFEERPIAGGTPSVPLPSPSPSPSPSPPQRRALTPSAAAARPQPSVAAAAAAARASVDELALTWAQAREREPHGVGWRAELPRGGVLVGGGRLDAHGVATKLVAAEIGQGGGGGGDGASEDAAAGGAASGGTLLVCCSEAVPSWERRLAQAGLPYLTHHGKAKLGRAASLSPHVVVLTTYGMIVARDALPTPDAGPELPGWQVRRNALPPTEKVSLLHLRRWRRLLLACSSPAQLANDETQRVRAVLALRATRRWALTPRAADGGECAAAWRSASLRGLLRAAGLDVQAARDAGAPGVRSLAAEMLLEDGARDADADADAAEHEDNLPAVEPERRKDGADGPFTRREFIEYYGQAEGLAAWRAAAPSGARGGGER